MVPKSLQYEVLACGSDLCAKELYIVGVTARLLLFTLSMSVQGLCFSVVIVSPLGLGYRKFAQAKQVDLKARNNKKSKRTDVNKPNYSLWRSAQGVALISQEREEEGSKLK